MGSATAGTGLGFYPALYPHERTCEGGRDSDRPFPCRTQAKRASAPLKPNAASARSAETPARPTGRGG